MRAPSSVCLSVCLAAMFAVSASAVFKDVVHSSRFTYHLFRRNGGATCSVCYGTDCWEMQRVRCEYYLLADRNVGVIQEQNDVVTEVDGLMYDLVEEATMSRTQSCIPFVSMYTDCNKENICVGCRLCMCDGRGLWGCNLETYCRPQEDPVVNHRLLVAVIENFTYKRYKRWIHQSTTTTAKPKNIAYADLVEWMYEAKPEVGQDIPSKTNEDTTVGSETVKLETTPKPQNTDNIDLDELLNTIGLPNNKRRKPQLDDNFYNIQDLVDDVKMMKSKDYDDFMNLFNGLDVNDPVEETTKVVIDLLASSINNNNMNNFINVDGTNDDLNYDLNQLSINIMKREVTKPNVTENTTEIENGTNSHINISSLTDDVLNPINNIIIEKEKEIKYLLQIKENLEKFIKSYNDTKIILSINNNETKNNETFSIYKVDFYPELEVDLRKINPDNLNKLLYKLKRDIYEAVRDIKVIQKMSKIRYLPPDLQTLITAMKSYIHNKGHQQNVTQNELVLVYNNTRRQQFHSAKPIQSYLVDMMRVLENKLPSPNVLTSLSPTTAKILKRVIKNNGFDDITIAEFKDVYDPDYNLTNNLRSIGTSWNRYIIQIDNSDPGDLLHALKLLHIGLSRDIAKIIDALILVNFAHSRRMVPVEGQIGEELTDQISKSLKEINDKIQKLSNLKKEKQIGNKKKSFLRKLKDFLKSSKNDIKKLVQNKVSKSDIIKLLAKKRLDTMDRTQINDYENVMRKWQDNLNIIPHRSKRSSVLEKLQNRMKNIIPKYLRGKLNPAIDAKKSKKSHHRRNKGKKNLTNTNYIIPKYLRGKKNPASDAKKPKETQTHRHSKATKKSSRKKNHSSTKKPIRTTTAGSMVESTTVASEP